jgi:hypothetical protein
MKGSSVIEASVQEKGGHRLQRFLTGVVFLFFLITPSLIEEFLAKRIRTKHPSTLVGGFKTSPESADTGPSPVGY